MAKIHDDEQRVLDFLDRSSWQHSWHLPRTPGGSFDWLNRQSIDTVKKEVEEARERARQLLNEAAFAEQWANQWERRLAEEEGAA